MNYGRSLASLPGLIFLFFSLTPQLFGEFAQLREEIQRIFGTEEYTAQSFGPAKWLAGGSAYTTLEKVEAEGALKQLVRYETISGRREVLVDPSDLVPPGQKDPIKIEDYSWSKDGRRLLIFTNSKKVWRRNTRGDYFVLDSSEGSLRKLGGDAPASTLMFAKFSPDATQVAYVRENNLYVEEVSTGKITTLTDDGSDTIVNGTSDWVYEEEFGVRDGFRWSPDGKRIAFWSFDTSGIGRFALVNNTETLYPQVTYIPYPKVGTTNSAVRIGVVHAGGGPVRWMQVPGDKRNTYIPRIHWTPDSRSLLLQHLNRLQNRNEVFRADVRTGRVKSVHTDISSTWVDFVDDVVFLDGGKAFLWLSEKDGWRHIYRVELESGKETLISDFPTDVIAMLGPDEAQTWVYFSSSPSDATQNYLYRARLDGSGPPDRVTPETATGTHNYQLSPDGRFAFHTFSRFEVPPQTRLVQLPEHQSIRTLEDNADLQRKAESLSTPPAEFFRIDIGEGIELDSWMIRPKDFSRNSRYPLLVFVYGEPAGQTVVDRWGGNRMLFHRALADAGFIVASFDNRGTPAPRGSSWRKVVYGTVGDLSSKEQAAAVQALVRKHPYIDPERVGVWGWSGGGSNTLNCLFRFPGIFKVGVSVAPVPDQRLYDTIYQERYMGLPEDNPEGYRVGSPLHFAEGLQGRLLLIHGTGDDNVHYQGTERLVNRLIELDKPFDFMAYPNRSHSIREGEGTSVHIHSLIARYLVENLLGRQF